MYEQAKPDSYFNKFGSLSQKVLAAKKRRKLLQQKVTHSQGQLNYTQNKLDRKNLRLTMQSVWWNNKAQARALKKKLKEQRYWSIQRQQQRLQQLRENTHLKRLTLKAQTREAKQWVRECKSTQAKMTKSRISELMTRTIEEREKEKKKRLCFRQKEMLDEIYRIQNIVSKDVQLRYLKSIDQYQRGLDGRVGRLENLKRIKEDIEVSGLQPKFIKE